MDHVSDWSPCETTTHQDHVVAHVIGATVLGSFVAGEAAHLLLDIGFLWTIYLDGEMNLLPQGVAIAELDGVTSADKTELAFDAQLLLNEGREARGLKRFSGATVDCLITAVALFGSDALRRVVIRGEGADIEIDTSLESGQVTVRSDSHIE
jgi:hypothetical protein